MNLELELSLVYLLEPGSRRRYEELVRSHRRHVAQLGYFADWFDERFSRTLRHGEKSPEVVGELLGSLGAAARCYVISVEEALDGREASLPETLGWLYSREGQPSLLICRPGELAYYHGDSSDGDDSVIAHRPPVQATNSR